uniref:DUF11 domain-containing protein n=1 Tax=Puniceibacterium confluentis TaxID=1958944 RepID=UPI003565340A
NDLGDDSLITSVDTQPDGTYAFVGLPSATTYRVEVDVNDADLPPGSQIGTSNPLVGVTVDSASFTVERNFGFDPQQSDLSITKQAFRAGSATVASTVVEGDVIDWVVTVSNAGPGSPSGVTVIEKIPSGFTYISDDAPATGDFYDPGTGVWFVDEILSGATETLTLRVRVEAGGDYTNIVEITESSLPDLDSDPRSGPLVDDLGDGVADDDEASVTLFLASADRILSGRVLRDDGAGGGSAHDGQATGGEAGTDKGQILLLDDTGALLARPDVGADGRWSYALAPAYSGNLTVSVAPAPGWMAISEAPGALPGLSNPNAHDGSFTFAPAPDTNYAGLDLGLIPLPGLSEDRETAVGAGQIAVLPHLYRAASSGTVTFLYDEVTEPAEGAFSFALFLDSDCDGNPELPVNDPIAVQAGEEICLISRVSASSGLAPGSMLTYRLTATTAFAGTTSSHAISNVDRVSVEVGGSQLVLIKTVRNETQGTPEGYSNQAAPGDVLVYRITIINPSQTAASSISIHDRTPPYTILAALIETPVNVGPTLICSVGDPATNVIGYAGPLRWECSGTHGAGAEGSVLFKVRVSP